HCKPGRAANRGRGGGTAWMYGTASQYRRSGAVSPTKSARTLGMMPCAPAYPPRGGVRSATAACTVAAQPSRTRAIASNANAGGTHAPHRSRAPGSDLGALDHHVHRAQDVPLDRLEGRKETCHIR